jgi:hypothetical protein
VTRRYLRGRCSAGDEVAVDEIARGGRNALDHVAIGLAAFGVVGVGDFCVRNGSSAEDPDEDRCGSCDESLLGDMTNLLAVNSIAYGFKKDIRSSTIDI